MGVRQETDLDKLIEESRRIQQELMRTVVRLDVFADQLAEEVAKLRETTGSESE